MSYIYILYDHNSHSAYTFSNLHFISQEVISALQTTPAWSTRVFMTKACRVKTKHR